MAKKYLGRLVWLDNLSLSKALQTVKKASKSMVSFIEDGC